MKLALSGTQAEWIGYGSFIANLRKGLAEMHPEVLWFDEKPPWQADTVLWATVPNIARGAHRNQWTATFTMWEATRLPESFRDTFHWFNQIIAPCDQNVDLFARYHPNVVKVPLGFDADVWKPVVRDEPKHVFRFLCAGQSLSLDVGRKGFDLAARAFLAAFPHWETMTPRPLLVGRALKNVPELPFVEAHTGRVPAKDLAGLVEGCHAYVGPSRGEGWGMWPMQAVATGMPAVVSAIPAHTEFSWMPGFRTVPVTESKAAYFKYGNAGNWWEPDVEALAVAMRDVYDRWPTYAAEAAQGAQTMHSRFTHRHMAAQVLDVLQAGKPGGGWQDFTPATFPVQVTRPVVCDIGETHYSLCAGEHQLTADAMRVLQEAGYAMERSES